MLRYLRGTVGYGLKYVSSDEVRLQGYTNLDWVRSAEDKKEHLRGLLHLRIDYDILV